MCWLLKKKYREFKGKKIAYVSLMREKIREFGERKYMRDIIIIEYLFLNVIVIEWEFQEDFGGVPLVYLFVKCR